MCTAIYVMYVLSVQYYFSSMLKDFDMVCVLQQNFYDFFTKQRHNIDDIQLLHRMKAFDPRRLSHLVWSTQLNVQFPTSLFPNC